MAKQRYLVKEVASKGFCKQAFSEFLQKRKPEHIPVEHALNIDLWSFEELDRVVLQFQMIEEKKGMASDSKHSEQPEEEQWEDLEYAEEAKDFGRVSKVPQIHSPANMRGRNNKV